MEKGCHPSIEKCSQESCGQNQRDPAEEKEIQADEVKWMLVACNSKSDQIYENLCKLSVALRECH